MNAYRKFDNLYNQSLAATQGSSTPHTAGHGVSAK